MEFRIAQDRDVDEIAAIYESGSQSLNKAGVDQWQGDEKPHIVENKLTETYVLYNKKCVSTAIVSNNDPNYDNIYNGKWLTEGNYMAIHRVATLSSETRKGYATRMFKEIEKLAISQGKGSLRIETHEKNIPMQIFLDKLGYVRCGLVPFRNIKSRVAFEKIL